MYLIGYYTIEDSYNMVNFLQILTKDTPYLTREGEI